MFLSSYLDNWWCLNFKIYLHSSPKQWPREKGIRESQKYNNLSISKNEKNFLDEVKSIFHNYLTAFICWIKEK